MLRNYYQCHFQPDIAPTKLSAQRNALISIKLAKPGIPQPEYTRRWPPLRYRKNTSGCHASGPIAVLTVVICQVGFGSQIFPSRFDSLNPIEQVFAKLKHLSRLSKNSKYRISMATCHNITGSLHSKGVPKLPHQFSICTNLK